MKNSSNLFHLSSNSISSPEVFTAIYLTNFLLEPFIYICTNIFLRFFHIYEKLCLFLMLSFSTKGLQMSDSVLTVSGGCLSQTGQPSKEQWSSIGLLAVYPKDEKLFSYSGLNALLIPLNGALSQCKPFPNRMTEKWVKRAGNFLALGWNPVFQME